MPISMPTVTTSVSHDGDAPRSTQLGPGHRPQTPQPVPKIAEPRTRKRSGILFRGGRSKAPPRTGPLKPWRSRIWKKGKVTIKPPPMTKPKLGSHAPEPKSRKDVTLLGRTMVLMVRPVPNAKPAKASAPAFHQKSASALAHRRAMKEAAAAIAIAPRAQPAHNAASCHSGASACVTGSGGKSLAVPRSVPTKTAAAMKVGTATHERGLRRARPVSPCPDVQPLAMAVPKPTSKPPPPKRKNNFTRSSDDKFSGGTGS
mmetsp:Transcript_109396/g.315067  ORF Transcript_109396/g.315067 Transcript_109396/m.315067 type:complete len:258 (+) Transcript_109396:267-1040(+)